MSAGTIAPIDRRDTRRTSVRRRALRLAGLAGVLAVLTSCAAPRPASETRDKVSSQYVAEGSYELAGQAVSVADLQTLAIDRCRLASPPDSAPPPLPFTTVGCHVGREGTWHSCCVDHDMAYWCGGTNAARRTADRTLRACVALHGGDNIAGWMYLGVRLGGAAWLPFTWRWGYGYPWPHLPVDPATLPPTLPPG
jgi:hypothetical protein